jgi:hypothetical protein
MANTQATSQKVADLATQTIDMAGRGPVLLGTFGPEAGMGALLRLPSGRVQRVAVGDRVAGLQITAIAPGTLHGTQRGQALTLQLPGN